MQSRARSSYAEPQPSLAVHLKCIAKLVKTLAFPKCFGDGGAVVCTRYKFYKVIVGLFARYACFFRLFFVTLQHGNNGKDIRAERTGPAVLPPPEADVSMAQAEESHAGVS